MHYNADMLKYHRSHHIFFLEKSIELYYPSTPYLNFCKILGNPIEKKDSYFMAKLLYID